jgi:hypothetical protein
MYTGVRSRDGECVCVAGDGVVVVVLDTDTCSARDSLERCDTVAGSERDEVVMDRETFTASATWRASICTTTADTMIRVNTTPINEA